jgi:hypothetical protein
LTNNANTVARTYRAAIRQGEDFITLEETIVLPLDATDKQIADAIGLGWRIYRAQQEAVKAQIADIRQMRSGQGQNVPRTAAEAEQRFFARYGGTVGGDAWLAVQRYISSRAPKPTTVEGWIAAAEAVRDEQRKRAEQPQEAPGVVGEHDIQV